MNISFDNILQQVALMEDFPLKWRFTNEKYYKLPKIHLNQLSPLNKEAARFL